MDFPTTLDVLLTRLHALELRLAVLEKLAGYPASVTACRDDLDTALARLGTAIKKVRVGGCNG